MTLIEAALSRLAQLGQELAHHVASLFVDPSQRTHWLGLLVSVAIVFVWSVRRGRWTLRVEHFLGPSARVDYGLILVKPILAAVFVLPWTVTTASVGMAVFRGLRGLAGATSWAQGSLPAWAVTVLYTAVLFVAWDFSRFALHVCMHRSRVLWQFHQVHHSAETLSPLTLYRVHPVESALYALRGVLVTGLLLGVFSFAFGSGTVQLELLGVNAVGLVFGVVSGNLRHSHVPWSFGPWLERWSISPAQHQLHHGAAPEDARSNYGTWLAVWDRAARSLRPASQTPVVFGLPPAVCNHRPHALLSALIDPIHAVLRRGRRAHDPSTTPLSQKLR